MQTLDPRVGGDYVAWVEAAEILANRSELKSVIFTIDLLPKGRDTLVSPRRTTKSVGFELMQIIVHVALNGGHVHSRSSAQSFSAHSLAATCAEEAVHRVFAGAVTFSMVQYNLCEN